MAIFNRTQHGCKFPEKQSQFIKNSFFLGFCISIFGSTTWKNAWWRFFFTYQISELKTAPSLQKTKMQISVLVIYKLKSALKIQISFINGAKR